MSNVQIVAIGEVGLEVDVLLGANVRKTHKVGADCGAVELTVGGGQTLVVRQSAEVAPTAEAEGDLPVGVDVDVDETADVVETAVVTSEPSVDAVAEVDLRDAEASETPAENGAVEATTAEVDDAGGVGAVNEDQADLFSGDNPFETEGEVETKE